MPRQLYRALLAALKPYEENHNTGVSYEIATVLWIARAGGLTDHEYASVASYVKTIAKKNPKGRAQILCALAAYAHSSRGRGVSIQGESLIGIRNASQNDQDGSTGDLILISESGRETSLSVFLGNPTNLEKCLKNPSCRGFGCTDTDVNTFKAIASNAVPLYEAEMRRRFGPERSAWKRRKSEAATAACATVAKLTAKRFNALSQSERQALYTKLLSLDARGLPCDCLAIVDKAMRPHFFRVAPKTIMTGQQDPVLRASGVFLFVSATASQARLAKVQVKFNNGVNSPIHSSWNAVVLLDQAFDVTPACLLTTP